MEILKTLLVVYMAISTVLFTVFLIGLIKNIRKELTKSKPTKEANLKLVTVEIVADRIMMYDAATHAFICQAATDEELWKTAQDMFPGKSLLRYIKP